MEWIESVLIRRHVTVRLTLCNIEGVNRWFGCAWFSAHCSVSSCHCHFWQVRDIELPIHWFLSKMLTIFVSYLRWPETICCFTFYTWYEYSSKRLLLKITLQSFSSSLLLLVCWFHCILFSPPPVSVCYPLNFLVLSFCFVSNASLLLSCVIWHVFVNQDVYSKFLRIASTWKSKDKRNCPYRKFLAYRGGDDGASPFDMLCFSKIKSVFISWLNGLDELAIKFKIEVKSMNRHKEYGKFVLLYVA